MFADCRRQLPIRELSACTHGKAPTAEAQPAAGPGGDHLPRRGLVFALVSPEALLPVTLPPPWKDQVPSLRLDQFVFRIYMHGLVYIHLHGHAWSEDVCTQAHECKSVHVYMCTHMQSTCYI